MAGGKCGITNTIKELLYGKLLKHKADDYSGDAHITYDYSRVISSTPLKIPVKAVEISNKILEEYEKDPNNPILFKLGEELYQEIERINK